jgi:alcohol dehydrogenase YqhD (iron-dependent ADH family)
MFETMSFTMYVPTKILFGAGMLNELHKQELPGKKAMIVISSGKSNKNQRLFGARGRTAPFGRRGSGCV